MEKELKIPDYRDKKTLDHYQAYLAYLYNYDLAEKGYKLAKALPRILAKHDPSLEKEDPDFWRAYRNIIKSAKILAVQFLPTEDILEIFRTDLVEAVSLDFPDFYEKVETKFLTFMFLEERDEFKKKLIKAMEENEERIGNIKIIINERESQSTVQNWLKDFRLNLGDRINNNLEVLNYLNTSRNLKLFKEEKDKIIVAKIFDIYSRLNIPSTQMEGFEEKITVIDENGIKRVFNKGIMEKIDIENEIRKDLELAKKISRGLTGEEKKSPEAIGEIKEDKSGELEEKIRKSVERFASLLQRVKEEEGKIIREIGGDQEKVNELLINFIANKDPEKTAAALFILARLRKIDRLMSEMPAKKIFMEEIIPLLSRQIGSISAPELIDKFKQDPNNPVYVKIFLKYILGKAFEGREEGGAFIATQLENILSVLENQEYLGLAFYNLKTDKYEWANVKKTESGDLIIE